MVYAALLRGINVGGRASVRMVELKAVFESLRFGNVTTYLQSGNVVFESDDTAAGGFASGIEAALSGRSGGSIRVLVRDAGAMAEIVTKNPLLRERRDLAPDQLHVTFLMDAKEPADAAALEKRMDPAERIAIRGREAYLYCPNGYGRTRLSNQALEKALDTVATTRNWNTTCALHRMMAAMEKSP